MAGLLARCENGHLFRSNAIEIAAGATVTMVNSGTNCPVCGAYAGFLDGTFHFDSNGVMTVLAAPAMTHHVLRRIKAAVDAGARGEIQRDEVLARLDAIDSKVADVVKAMSKSNGWPDKLLWAVVSAVLGVLLAMAIAKAKASSPSPSDAEIRAQIERVVDEVVAQEKAPRSTTPPPTIARPAQPARTPPATPGGPNRAERRKAMKRKPGNGGR
ncbi:MAG: hypothetical protein QOK28_3582 [Actinomycetota bacterium]